MSIPLSAETVFHDTWMGAPYVESKDNNGWGDTWGGSWGSVCGLAVDFSDPAMPVVYYKPGPESHLRKKSNAAKQVLEDLKVPEVLQPRT